MQKEYLDKHIIKLASVSEEEAQQFSDLFEVKKVRRKEIILKPGEICDFEAFVTRGLCKIYHIDFNGFEQILYFAIEDWWLADLDSFNNKRPSGLYIQAIEDSELLTISKEKKEYALKNIPFVEKLFRIMTQNSHVALQRRMIENLSTTADQRYLNFIEKYPIIANRLTNIQIAAYLGISHELVSRIRKKIVLTDK